MNVTQNILVVLLAQVTIGHVLAQSGNSPIDITDQLGLDYVTQLVDNSAQFLHRQFPSDPVCLDFDADNDLDIFLPYGYAPADSGALASNRLYANTDTGWTDITKEQIVPSVVELSKDADALIHDSHFHEDDLVNHRAWGHSSWVECTEVARLAKAKQLYLFHYSPNYNDVSINDMEARAKKAFPSTIATYQGLEVELPAK